MKRCAGGGNWWVGGMGLGEGWSKAGGYGLE